MSEDQYYEFRNLSADLTEQQQRCLREISSRASISSSHFINEYRYGDLHAKPIDLMAEFLNIEPAWVTALTDVLPVQEKTELLDDNELKKRWLGQLTEVQVQFTLLQLLNGNSRICQGKYWRMAGNEADKANSKGYDSAAQHILDLAQAYQLNQAKEAFYKRLAEFIQPYLRKHSFIKRLQSLGINV